MRIISFNANGIRSAASKGFFDWFAAQDADALCVQETKAQEHQLGDGLFLVGRIDLTLGGQPVQEAGQGGAVAAVRLARALELDAVLAGPRHRAGIHAAHDRRAGGGQGVEVPGGGLAGIDQHGLAGQVGQGGVQGVWRFQ